MHSGIWTNMARKDVSVYCREFAFWLEIILLQTLNQNSFICIPDCYFLRFFTPDIRSTTVRKHRLASIMRIRKALRPKIQVKHLSLLLDFDDNLRIITSLGLVACFWFHTSPVCEDLSVCADRLIGTSCFCIPITPRSFNIEVYDTSALETTFSRKHINGRK